MKRRAAAPPAQALETGPLPGLSETNYKVLAGVTALGVAAPALLFVSNVVLPEMTKCKPVHKSNCRRVSAMPIHDLHAIDARTD